MSNSDAWARFRQRIIDGNQQAEVLKAWRDIAALTRLPGNESLERLRTIVIDQMDEAAFQLFWNAMILVNATYAQRAGLLGVNDPAEWQKQLHVYLDGSDTDAAQYGRFLTLRCALEEFRKPKELAPPYSAEELELSGQCNELFNRLAIVLIQAAPGAASHDVIDELAEIIGLHRELLVHAKPTNRARRQVLEAIAEATYATGRTHLILKKYGEAERSFQIALEAFEALGASNDAQASRQQLAGISIQSGNVDAAVRANLEVLTGEEGQARSLQRASALVSQLTQTVKVGDAYEADKLLESAVAELERQLYLDPGRDGIERSFAKWVEMVPAGLRGNDFFRELAQVVQLYAGIYGARATLRADELAQDQLRALLALLDPMSEESLNADEDLQQRFLAASAQPLAADSVTAAS